MNNERSALLLGNEALEILKNKTVLVVGIGGVGSFCVEALARTEIGHLILVDKDTVSPMEEDVITAPIYDLEIETGTIISPIVMTRKAWEAAKRKTVFYYNVMKDGVLL